MPPVSPRRLGLLTAVVACLAGCVSPRYSVNMTMPLPPPKITVTDTRLVIHGSIVADLERIVGTMPDSVKLVVLDSPGGMSDPGDRMAREFRRRGITAYVPAGGSCYSSCAVMLAGAVNRIVHPTAQVMVHARILFHGPLTKRTQVILDRENTETARQMIDWGVDPEFAMNALKLPRETHQRFLNARSALRVGLATAIGALPEADAALRATCEAPPLGTGGSSARASSQPDHKAKNSGRRPADATRLPPPDVRREGRGCPSFRPPAP